MPAAVATAADQAAADEVCFVVAAEALPASQASTGADRLLAVIRPDNTGELLLTLMLPTDM
ncbi:hypothetical protein GCM10010451_35960 [Streptomyces virens]|nr:MULTISPECIES: hypothetical protein [Streptomyces]MBA8946346.1 hypothetical protein [Streptomyces calvus]MBA8980181.1 hypothetical protein [Streptomyces calvus]MYS30444.1 hypothetical protein [Streptomyces sp. SID7804]GGP84802.1 hypothetical protein GCM10010247_67580 [Streptomyces calvus]